MTRVPQKHCYIKHNYTACHCCGHHTQQKQCPVQNRNAFLIDSWVHEAANLYTRCLQSYFSWSFKWSFTCHGKQWERFQYHSDAPGFQGSPKASQIPIAIFPLDACSSRKVLVMFSLEGEIAFVLETRTGSYCSFELKIDLKIVALPKEESHCDVTVVVVSIWHIS